MIKYKTQDWGKLITKVECEKETEKSVWIKGMRCYKMSNYHCFFDTFNEAKTYLLGLAKRKEDYARSRLNSAKDFYGNVKGWKLIEGDE